MFFTNVHILGQNWGSFFPYTRTVEGDFRVKDDSGRYYVAVKIHIYGNNQAYGIESRKGYVTYTMARSSNIESSLLAYGKPKVLDYLSVLSEISTIDTGDGNMTSLRQKYDSLKYLFKGSLLAAVIVGDEEIITTGANRIVPNSNPTVLH